MHSSLITVATITQQSTNTSSKAKKLSPVGKQRWANGFFGGQGNLMGAAETGSCSPTSLAVDSEGGPDLWHVEDHAVDPDRNSCASNSRGRKNRGAHGHLPVLVVKLKGGRLTEIDCGTATSCPCCCCGAACALRAGRDGKAERGKSSVHLTTAKSIANGVLAHLKSLMNWRW